MKDIPFVPAPYRQVTDPLTGLWVRGYIGQSDAELQAQLALNKERLSVQSWREYHAWRLE